MDMHIHMGRYVYRCTYIHAHIILSLSVNNVGLSDLYDATLACGAYVCVCIYIYVYTYIKSRMIYHII
jgi:hypothetical protein